MWYLGSVPHQPDVLAGVSADVVAGGTAAGAIRADAADVTE